MNEVRWSGFYGPAYDLLLHAKRQFGEVPENVWLECIRACAENPPGEGHWEFLGTGYLHLVARNGPQLPPTDRARIASLLPHLQRRHSTVNWRLMAEIIRLHVDGRRPTIRDLRSAGAVLNSAGCFEDTPGDESSQYHAYILLLILRFAEPATDIASWCRIGLQWLMDAWRKHGDPSPLGRGRFQLFGYSAMAACGRLAQEHGLPVDVDWLLAVESRLIPETPYGALSAVWTGPYRESLLYGYNTAVDYASFCRLWAVDSDVDHPVFQTPRRGLATHWVHSFDHGKGCVVADADGPLAAVTVDAPLSPGGFSTIARRFGRSWSRSKSATPVRRDLPLESWTPVAESGPFVLSRKADLVQWRLADELLRPLQIEEGRTLWIPGARKATCFASGSVELGELSWTMGSALWHGYRARVVRNGSVEIQWRI